MLPQDHHVCNGTCYDFRSPCEGRCQSDDFYMCSSGDQCYRYWDNCDGVHHCADGSDENAVCKLREMIVYFVPSLMTVLILTLIVIVLVLKVRKSDCCLRDLDLHGDVEGDEAEVVDSGVNHVVDSSSHEGDVNLEEEGAALTSATTTTATTTTATSKTSPPATKLGRSVSAETAVLLAADAAAAATTTSGGGCIENGKKGVRVTLINLKTRSRLTVEHQRQAATSSSTWWKFFRHNSQT